MKCVKCGSSAKFIWTISLEPLCKTHFLERFYKSFKKGLSSPLLKPTSTLHVVYNDSLLGIATLHALCHIERKYPSTKIIVYPFSSPKPLLNAQKNTQIEIVEEPLHLTPSSLMDFISTKSLSINKEEIIILPLTVEELASLLLYLFFRGKIDNIKMLFSPQVRSPLSTLFTDDVKEYGKILNLKYSRKNLWDKEEEVSRFRQLVLKIGNTSPTSIPSIKSFFIKITSMHIDLKNEPDPRTFKVDFEDEY